MRPSRPRRGRRSFRPLSIRQVNRIRTLVDQAGAKGISNADANKLLDQAILVGITGWANVTDDAGQAVAFSPEALDAAFTEDAKIWFCLLYPDRVGLSEIDLKKFVSRSPSSTAASAEPAGGDATTSPPQKSL